MSTILLEWCVTSMDDTFQDEEYLFRMVRPDTDYWKADGTLTSAAFKTSNGLSVDRCGDRSFEEAVAAMQARPDLAGTVVSLTVGDCRSAEALVRYLPSRSNIYHSEIHQDATHIKLSPDQAKKLARLAKKCEDASIRTE